MRRTLTSFGQPLALVAALAWPSAAHADPRDDARRHFSAALQAAADGDLARALERFQQAFGAIPHPVTAYNIARAYEELGDIDNAVVWYRRTLELDPGTGAEVGPILARLEPLVTPEPTVASLRQPVVSDPRARLRALEDEAQRLRDALGIGEDPALAPTEGVSVDGIAMDFGDVGVDEPAPGVSEPSGGEKEATEDPAPVDMADTPAEPAPADRPAADVPRTATFASDPYAEVIVTASRYGQEPLDSPQSVTVLTAEDIQMSGAVHIADVLRRVVGVNVMSMSSGVPWLGVRGFNTEMNNKVLWLVDGRPAMLAFLGSALPFTLGVTLEEIERIEIIRGPGAAIYGANAVTGVINIITRRPGEGPPVQAVVQSGYNDYARASVVASGGTGRVSYRFAGGYQQEGRFETELDEVPAGGPFRSFNDDLDLGDRRVQASGRVDTTFADKGWASVSGSWVNGMAEYYSKAALGNFGLDGNFGSLRGDLGYGPFRVRTFWQREAGRTASWLGSSGSLRSTEAQVRDDVVNVQIEGDFKAVTGPVSHRVLVGAGYEYRNYRAGQIGFGFEVPRPENHLAAFAQYQLDWSFLQSNLSLRYDKHALLGPADTISPRGALVFRVAKKTALRMSAGTAFRAMNGLESYVNLQLNTAADGYFVNFFGAATNPRGNNLGPERTTNAEIGLRDESSAIHAIDVVGYWNRVSDLIDIGSVEPVLSGFIEDGAGWPFGQASWINDGNTLYDALGAEVDLTLFPTDGLDVFANIAVQRITATFTDPDSGERDRFVDNSNGLVHANIGVQYRSPWYLDVTLTGHIVSRQDWRVPAFDDRGVVEVSTLSIPARFLMVTRIVGHPITKKRPDLELGVTLWNPLGFGKGFREHPLGQIVGPRVYGHMGLTF